MNMLSRPTPSFHLARATLIATAASLLLGGGLTVAHMSQDTCSVATDGLDPHARALVARRVLACQDYEHGRITKDDYRAMIAEIDLAAPPSRVVWASSVLGYSTQYSDTAWSAQQALGAPNVYPKHGDIQQAWASRTADDQDEWIELGFDVPRSVSAVEIYETYNPGAIGTVELITTRGQRIQLRGPTLEHATSPSNKLVLQTACTAEPIAAVRINVESTGTQGWNEIDAVGLVPCTSQMRARGRDY